MLTELRVYRSWMQHAQTTGQCFREVCSIDIGPMHCTVGENTPLRRLTGVWMGAISCRLDTMGQRASGNCPARKSASSALFTQYALTHRVR